MNDLLFLRIALCLLALGCVRTVPVKQATDNLQNAVGHNAQKSSQNGSQGRVYNRLLDMIKKNEAAQLTREEFDGPLDMERCSGNCPEIIRIGEERFLRARLDHSMKVPFRTEYVFRKQAPLLINGPTYIIYFKMKMKPENQVGHPKGMFFQVHAVTWKGESEDGWQPIVGRMLGDSLRAVWQCERLNGKRDQKAISLLSDQWQEIMVIFKLADNQDGQIRVYRNGVMEYDAKGSNCDSWKDPLYLKLGLYTASYKKEVNRKTLVRREVDYDDVLVLDVSSASRGSGGFGKLAESLISNLGR